MRRASTPGRTGGQSHFGERGISEKDFQAQILDLARLAGWKAYHTSDSRRSAKGFPDLCLVRPPVVLFAELKSATGRVSPEQVTWLEALKACESVEARLWRPSDFEEIERTLCQRRRGGRR